MKKFKRIFRKEQKCRNPRINALSADMVGLLIREEPIIKIDLPLMSYGIKPLVTSNNLIGLSRLAYSNIRKFRHYAKINPNYYRKIDNNRRKK